MAKRSSRARNEPARVCLVTGCASGIGRHLVGVLVAHGHRVVATDLELKKLKAAAKADAWQPDRVMLMALDVRNAAQWERAVELAVAKLGSVDVVLNVAGYLRPGYIHETEASDVDRHIDVNTKGVIFGTRAAARMMVPRGEGHIVNIASLAAIAPVPGLCLYSASKFAVRGFSLAVSQELARFGVAVTTVCPDAVQTPMLDLQVDYEEAALTFSGDRVLTVEDVAQAILRALDERPMEVLIPIGRASLAKVVNAFPQIADRVKPLLRRKGLSAQRRVQKQRAGGATIGTTSRNAAQRRSTPRA